MYASERARARIHRCIYSVFRIGPCLRLINSSTQNNLIIQALQFNNQCSKMNTVLKEKNSHNISISNISCYIYSDKSFTTKNLLDTSLV